MVRQRLLSAKEVAIILGCSVRSIWKMTASGRLPEPVRSGQRFVRWRVEDIDAWITETHGSPTGPR